MSGKIKTAILGYGKSGSSLHADPLEKSPEFEVTVICDIDENAQKEAKARFGNSRVYTCYKQMLKDEELDLVVIVTRSSQHADMTCDCLNAGKNVLVTKPWAVNAAEAEKMIAAAKASGKLLMPWLPARWGGDLRRLRELIDSGVVGKVFQVRRSDFSFGLREDWQTLKEFGGGYLLNWGPHLVDQPIQLVNKPIKSVYGEMRQIMNPGDVEDVFYAVIKTDDDTIIVSECNIGANELPDWMVQGDKATIFVKGRKIEIHKAVFDDKPIGKNMYRKRAAIEVTTEMLSDEAVDSPFGDEHVIYAHIADAVRGKQAYHAPVESALMLTRVLDAVRESSEAGKVVAL